MNTLLLNELIQYFRGMISRQVENAYTVHKSDKYKNRETSNSAKYEDVKPLATFLDKKGEYSVVILDPPYSSQGGGHTAINCNLDKSAGALKFNEQYGTAVQYTPPAILNIVVESIARAEQLLVNGGFLLIKCKDYRGLPYSSEITRLTREKGVFSYWGTYIFSTRDKVVRNSNQYSNMLVFKKSPTGTLEIECSVMRSIEVSARANVDYQTMAIDAKRKEAFTNEKYAELLVHYAEHCGTFENFKEELANRYQFDKLQVSAFLRSHNMDTKEKFARNRANGSTLRKQRTKNNENKKQKKIDW